MRSKIIGMLIVWIAGIICVPIMKKLEPESYKAYAIYVLAVDVIFTAFIALCV